MGLQRRRQWHQTPVAPLRPTTKEKIQKLWTQFVVEADAAGLTDLYGLMALAFRSMVEGGECFARRHGRAMSDGLPDLITKRLEANARKVAETAAGPGLAPLGLTKQQFVQAMVRCAPIHPLAVLGLVRLCRKFGQHQRSLFSFLVSQEPHGFAEFLQRPVEGDSLPWYRLDTLVKKECRFATKGAGVQIGIGIRFGLIVVR